MKRQNVVNSAHDFGVFLDWGHSYGAKQSLQHDLRG